MKKLLLILILLISTACATTKPLPLVPYKPESSNDPLIESLLQLENNPSLVQNPAFMEKLKQKIHEAGLCDACQKGDAK